jgi:hypothetical protein
VRLGQQYEIGAILLGITPLRVREGLLAEALYFEETNDGVALKVKSAGYFKELFH